MTKKQTTTLVLFAQNYSLVAIAKKQKVSLTTIRERIKALSKNHSMEFNSAFGIRESYKRTRDGIRNAARNSIGFQLDFDWETRVETVGGISTYGSFDWDAEIRDKF